MLVNQKLLLSRKMKIWEKLEAMATKEQKTSAKSGSKSYNGLWPAAKNLDLNGKEYVLDENPVFSLVHNKSSLKIRQQFQKSHITRFDYNFFLNLYCHKLHNLFVNST